MQQSDNLFHDRDDAVSSDESLGYHEDGSNNAPANMDDRHRTDNPDGYFSAAFGESLQHDGFNLGKDSVQEYYAGINQGTELRRSFNLNVGSSLPHASESSFAAVSAVGDVHTAAVGANIAPSNNVNEIGGLESDADADEGSASSFASRNSVVANKEDTVTAATASHGSKISVSRSKKDHHDDYNNNNESTQITNKASQVDDRDRVPSQRARSPAVSVIRPRRSSSVSAARAEPSTVSKAVDHNMPKTTPVAKTSKKRTTSSHGEQQQQQNRIKTPNQGKESSSKSKHEVLATKPTKSKDGEKRKAPVASKEIRDNNKLASKMSSSSPGGELKAGHNNNNNSGVEGRNVQPATGKATKIIKIPVCLWACYDFIYRNKLLLLFM